MTNHVGATVPAEPPMPASMNRHPRAAYETLFLQPLVTPQLRFIFFPIHSNAPRESRIARLMGTATIASFLTATLPLPSL
jgi:hypothetical protein